MEYRGIDYSIIRAASGAGWRWSVVCEDTERVGMHASREGAMLNAERFIDEVIRYRKQAGQLRSKVAAPEYT
jgi:hypothetical protein